ncbi:MAG: hypothetical protein WA477_05745, partial [Candidatus Sulfotelmatobacter sp.]
MFRRTIEYLFVGNHDLWTVFKDAAQSFRGRSRIGYNGYVGLIFKQASQTLPKQHQIMHESASNIPIFLNLCGGTHGYSLGPERILVARRG